MKKYSTFTSCGECTFFKFDDDASGIGYCDLMYRLKNCDDECNLEHTTISAGRTASGLAAYNKWRRGGKGNMPMPYVIGKLIDSAVFLLRRYGRERIDCQKIIDNNEYNNPVESQG